MLAGNPVVHTEPGDLQAGSGNINAGNFFNSPDGLIFDDNGMLWIQTDGKYSNKGDFEGMGNNQMLVGDPQTGEILGGHVVGPEAAELFHELIAVMYYRGTVQDLMRIPHYHPTLAEILTYPAEELAEQIEGR